MSYTEIETAIQDIETFEHFDHMLPPLELLDLNGIPYIEPLELD